MKTSSGPEPIRWRLNRCAIATVLVGVVLLVLARPVSAEIVYRSASIKKLASVKNVQTVVTISISTRMESPTLPSL
jgi:hypothetical protein